MTDFQHVWHKNALFFGNKIFPNAGLFSCCLLQLKDVTLDNDRQAPHMLCLAYSAAGPGNSRPEGGREGGSVGWGTRYSHASVLLGDFYTI